VINIAIILTLLVAPYFVACVFHLNVVAAGRIGICAVFLFAAIGHFFRTEQMMQMLPSFVPARRALIYISGVVEVSSQSLSWRCPICFMLVCASSAI